MQRILLLKNLHKLLIWEKESGKREGNTWRKIPSVRPSSPSHIKHVIAKIKCAVWIVNNVLASEKSVIISSDIYTLKCECDSATEIIDSCLPIMKSRTHEFTDGGTRCQSVIMISKLDFMKLFLLQVLLQTF